MKQVGSQMYVQITRINEDTNDFILSEKEAWVSFYCAICCSCYFFMENTLFFFFFFFVCSYLSLYPFIIITSSSQCYFAGDIKP